MEKTVFGYGMVTQFRKHTLIGFILGAILTFGALIAGWIIYGAIPPQDVTANMIWVFVVSGIGFTTIVTSIALSEKYPYR